MNGNWKWCDGRICSAILNIWPHRVLTKLWIYTVIHPYPVVIVLFSCVSANTRTSSSVLLLIGSTHNNSLHFISSYFVCGNLLAKLTVLTHTQTSKSVCHSTELAQYTFWGKISIGLWLFMHYAFAKTDWRLFFTAFSVSARGWKTDKR